ncbi:MAG TPA: CAP domain-containing protein [Candidatus Saccharimonadales bacterium]|nr:CAP domain-containing protein [Candidatus Saccharimonadales bacterium]
MQFFHLLAVITAFVTGITHPGAQLQSPETQVLAAATIKPLPTVTPVSIFSPTPTSQQYFYPARIPKSPIIDCVGPDGKHFHTTQKACDDFNSAWQERAVVSVYPTSPYGQATKIADHTYELKLPPDSTMTSARELFSALNSYRQRKGISALSWNDSLSNYAQDRANFYTSKGYLDSHAGFMNFINNQDGFDKLGFNHLGENAAYAGPLSGIHLIEWVFAADEEHNSNQLNSDWKSVGIGVNGIATDIVFASSPR